MKNDTLKIEFSREDFKDLLLLVLIGTYLKEAVEEIEGKDFEKTREIEKFLLKCAYDKNWNEIAEVFYNNLVPTEELCQEYERIIDEFNNDQFWYELSRRLGQRDFEREMTEEDKEFIKKEGYLPDKINQYYQKYEKEFEKYGIERLEIRK